MKKIDVLVWGMKHIASNYKLGSDTESYEEDGQMCVYVTNERPTVTPAPINDVQMLCDDLGIDGGRIDVGQYGIDVSLDYSWLHTKDECEGYCDTSDAGLLLEEYNPTGMEMWKRHDATIGA